MASSILKKIILIAIFLVPVFYLADTIFPAVFSKAIFIEGITILALSFLLFDIFIYKKEFFVPKNVVLFVFLLYVFFMFISSINSVVPALSFWGSFGRGTGFIFLITLFVFSIVTSMLFKTKEDWIKIFSAFVYSGILFTVGVFLSHSDLSFFYNIGDSSTGFTMGNSSYAGVYLSFVFFIAVGLFFYSNKRFLKISCILGALSVILNPTITGFLIPGYRIVGESKASFFSIIIGLLLLGLFLLIKKFFLNENKKIIALILLILFIFVGLFVLGKTSYISELIFNKVGPNRLVFWDIALKGFLDKPILGWGQNTFSLVYVKYFNPIVTMPGFYPEYLVDRAHNIFFDELVSGGILGALSLFVLYGVILFGLLRGFLNEGKNSEERYLFASIFTGMVVFLIQGVLFFQTIAGWLVVAVLISFVANFCFAKKTILVKSSIESIQKRLLVFSVVVLLIFTCFVYVVVKPYYLARAFSKLPEMSATERGIVCKRIQNAYMGNTEDLTDAFYPFYVGTLKEIKSGNVISEADRNKIVDGTKMILPVLEGGIEKEKYMDLRLMATTTGFYSLLTRLAKEEEKEAYYEKGMFYVKKMFEISPQNPISDISFKGMKDSKPGYK